jgi:hypothetical protein
MGTHLVTRLKIESWDEKPYRELEDGSRFTRASVQLTVSEERIQAEATWDALMHYLADGTSSYVGLMHLTGRLGDRSGSFVLQGGGTFDGKRASGESVVVSATATGGLSGLTGTATSVSTHEDYPFMPLTLDYDVR